MLSCLVACRREANQLTRQWQKALQVAARAYSTGDHEGEHARPQCQHGRAERNALESV